MAEQTIHIFAKSGVTVTHVGGGAPRNGDVIGNALNGNAFSWENPNDLALTFGRPDTALSFDDRDGILGDDPFSGATVVDQRLTQPVTVNGVTYTPNSETIRWKSPPPVAVENEYEVTLYDAAGTPYRMVGVSITTGYTTQVVGVMFDGPTPPPGTTLFYRQGVSSYSGSGQTLVIPPPAVPCFLAGTRIATPTGLRAIETLRAGDRVITLSGQAVPIRWIGRSTVDGRGALAPIRIAKGTFETLRDLYLSPNHRVFLRSARAELYLGQREVLVAAKFLIDGASVTQVPMASATYLHLLLDDHQLVFSEGIATESLFTGAGALHALPPAARAELLAIFPDLATRPARLSRRSLTRPEARLILQDPAALAPACLPATRFAA